MKLNKQILEAIQRGINLAIDDFDDVQDIETQKVGQIENEFSTKEQLKLRKYFVDLCLPSGILWGKYNVGVDPNKLNKPVDWYGSYYAWGEIEEKQDYSWKTYKYINGLYNKLTKYCNDADYCNYKQDNLTTLQDEDDVAVQTNKLLWPVKMPTKEQIEELIEYTTNEQVENYQGITGLNGRIFTSKQNGNILFIPAAGYRAVSSIYSIGSNCFLWSSSLCLDTPTDAYVMYFYSSDCYLESDDRCYGFSTRAVLNNI